MEARVRLAVAEAASPEDLRFAEGMEAFTIGAIGNPVRKRLNASSINGLVEGQLPFPISLEKSEKGEPPEIRGQALGAPGREHPERIASG